MLDVLFQGEQRDLLGKLVQRQSTVGCSGLWRVGGVTGQQQGVGVAQQRRATGEAAVAERE
ncbi:hypothetical protein M4D79_13710 [Mycolicibacterium novocastrense]|nr:hypothetical protein M4D79_13710 [Mycolicibacterium novocastrense]